MEDNRTEQKVNAGALLLASIVVIIISSILYSKTNGNWGVMGFWVAGFTILKSIYLFTTLPLDEHEDDEHE